METTRQPAAIAAILLIVAASLTFSAPRAAAQSKGGGMLTASASTVNHNVSQPVERLEMLVKSSRILTLEQRIPKFQVHNEEVIGATPISQNQVQIFAKTPGTTQLNLWDTDDQLYTVDVTVTADAREVEGILSSQLPLASVKVTPVNNSAIVSGYVTSVDDVDRAMAIVEQFYTTVINNIQVVGVQQVLLHTKIMEVSRTKLRDLGIDWGGGGNGGTFFSGAGGLLNAASSTATEALATTEGGLQATNRLFAHGSDFTGLIAALRQQNLIKMLAEPTIVATHGRPARFIVGGKVPYIVPSGNGSVSINYEEYGTLVDFLPFVVGPGRIRLEIRPEVSEPDESRSINASGIRVPAFTQRYAETSVEMQAGQTFAIAGLLQTRTEAFTRATPFFGEIPLVGSLFRRVRERRNDVELLITVTPELVDAMDPCEVPPGGPGLNSMSPDDYELYHGGHIEVPNLLASDCNCVGPCGCGQPFSGSYSPEAGGMIRSNPPGTIGDPMLNAQPVAPGYSPGHSPAGAPPIASDNGIMLSEPAYTGPPAD